ncbi:hypothetical protein SODALDRAFT_330846 [Sodiomyces alkalinus F11]|uniref:RlpA-like protein double-psi beta-barrel domain-containing protein n=1 Tax=Sodiomyces alkalinus (strain CBS 110278 / VKM F-3762 / F11) TaxID=1314773 RepID=A0A3N2Q2Z4_SODAK|nr:hypothetical protein SODALDRAFT_330846 [Sodiomyces alkalinus F11]ROT41139.1 hypothetical protein SODALDRAFT_330846 [Sodiomyces alkalinus F11]
MLFKAFLGATIMALLGLGASAAAIDGNNIGELQARQDMFKGPFKGDLTFYDTGLGACGFNDTGRHGIVALSHHKMGTASNNNLNPHCNRRVRLRANGKTVEGIVRDKCMGCAKEDIDVSPDMFAALYDLGVGRARVTWEVI